MNSPAKLNSTILRTKRLLECPPLLTLILSLMSLLAAAWLGYEFWRLLWQPEPLGAIDLRLRQAEVHAWFAGRKVYGEMVTAVYPPASYLLLWPLTGWLSLTAARALWAALTLAGAAWLARLTVRETLARTRREKIFAALIPLALYATGASAGNGQPLLFLLPALLAAVLLLESEARIKCDLSAAALFLFALLKPSVTAPFFWILLFRPGRIRPAAFVLSIYLCLTFAAAAFQPGTMLDVMKDWTGRARAGVVDTREGIGRARAGEAESRSNVYEGGASAQDVEAAPQFLDWRVSLLILAAAGAWTYAHRRRVDIWLLLGVLAFVARFWTYQRWYDDLLLLFPTIALLRTSRQRARTTTGAVSDVLFVLMLLSLLAPGGLYLLPGAWKSFYLAAQALVWALAFFFLLRIAWRERRDELCQEINSSSTAS